MNCKWALTLTSEISHLKIVYLHHIVGKVCFAAYYLFDKSFTLLILLEFLKDNNGFARYNSRGNMSEG